MYAAEANQTGRGGKSVICRLTNMSRSTLNQGMKDLQTGSVLSGSERIRKQGAGRKKQTDDQPQLKGALESLIEPVTSGDSESALRWTLKSSHTSAGELTAQGFKTGKTTVTNLLSELGYSLQSNRKGLEGKSHPDRNYGGDVKSMLP
ncbi:hypothetical protein EZS27_033817 [termite gut metagenome]|uniref:ISAzo13 family transposase n=1 Tax=termite gut metagenome TaxID=433724 RepID=A0A5J4Q206_9ZZZZ